MVESQNQRIAESKKEITRSEKEIRDRIGLPRLDVLPESRRRCPSASSLPAPLTSRYFISVSVFLSSSQAFQSLSLSLSSSQFLFINIYLVFCFIWCWCWCKVLVLVRLLIVFQCWCWCLLVRYNKLALSDWLQSCDWGHGALGQGSASVLCASTSASVQLIINKYGCVCCVLVDQFN